MYMYSPHQKLPTKLFSQTCNRCVVQLNQATSFIDGSHMYGSTSERERSLRSYFNGHLLMVPKNGRMYLPPSDTPQDHCQVQDDTKPCYKSGKSPCTV